MYHRYIVTVTHDTITSYSCPTDAWINYFIRYRNFIYLYHCYMNTICNTPIPRVRRHYCDVYTQDINTLIYTLSISTSRIRVRKYSGNIHSNNNNTSTQLSQSMIQYYKNIRSLRKSMIFNIKDWKILTNNKMRISRTDQGTGRKGAPDWQPLIHISATLLNLDMNVQGCQKITHQVHKMKPSGVFRQSHVYIIKWRGSGIPIQAMTSNINENHRISSKFEIK